MLLITLINSSQGGFSVTISLSSGRVQALGIAVFVSALISGCGSGGIELPTGQVSGTITFEGAPVTEGFVNLISVESGRAATMALGPGGKFGFEEPVVIGPYAVFITPPEGAPPTLENESPAPPDPKNIPKKYRTDATTDFKVEVKEGDNGFPLDMKS